MWSTILLLVAALIVAAIGAVIYRGIQSYRNQARRAGYLSLSSYLNAVPGSDTERRDAVDLALSGLVICILGLVFPPLLLLGLFPLYYGARKVAYSAMGLGLLEDADPPSQ